MKGWGKLAGNSEVEVTLLDGGKSSIPAKNIIIATGSEVSPLPGLTIDEERYVDCFELMPFALELRVNALCIRIFLAGLIRLWCPEVRLWLYKLRSCICRTCFLKDLHVSSAGLYPRLVA